MEISFVYHSILIKMIKLVKSDLSKLDEDVRLWKLSHPTGRKRAIWPTPFDFDNL